MNEYEKLIREELAKRLSPEAIQFFGVLLHNEATRLAPYKTAIENPVVFDAMGWLLSSVHDMREMLFKSPTYFMEYPVPCREMLYLHKWMETTSPSANEEDLKAGAINFVSELSNKISTDVEQYRPDNYYIYHLLGTRILTNPLTYQPVITYRMLYLLRFNDDV